MEYSKVWFSISCTTVASTSITTTYITSHVKRMDQGQLLTSGLKQSLFWLKLSCYNVLSLKSSLNPMTTSISMIIRMMIIINQ
jgi:hypothetical protein